MPAHLVIIGGQRCGTTYLHHVLDDHPEISMNRPVRPEPKYFLNDNSVLTLDDYRAKFFAHAPAGIKYLGEKSTSYFDDVNSSLRINALLPEAKILVILRHPVHRAVSHYEFSKANGKETLPFRDAIEAESQRTAEKFDSSVNPYLYVGRSRYAEFLRRHESVFGRERMKVLILEEFVGDLNSIQGLYAWLGVESDFVPKNLDAVVNEGVVSQIDQKEQARLRHQLEPSVRDLEEYLGRSLDCWS